MRARVLAGIGTISLLLMLFPAGHGFAQDEPTTGKSDKPGSVPGKQRPAAPAYRPDSQ